MLWCFTTPNNSSLVVFIELTAGTIRANITIALLMHRWIIHVTTCLLLLKLTQETIRREDRRSHPTVEVVIRDVIDVHCVLQTLVKHWHTLAALTLWLVGSDHQVLQSGGRLREPRSLVRYYLLLLNMGAHLIFYCLTFTLRREASLRINSERALSDCLLLDSVVHLFLLFFLADILQVLMNFCLRTRILRTIITNKFSIFFLDVRDCGDKFLLARHACFTRFYLDFVVGVLFHNFFRGHS